MPARFCRPTPGGIADALDLDPPDGLEDEARTLQYAAGVLLTELMEMETGRDRDLVTCGLSARDADERAALDAIAAKDAEVNAGLSGLDDLLDSLGQQAREMNAQTRKQNETLEVMRGGMGAAGARAAGVNARANCNVKYYS